jgi:hypothetical protein
VQHVRRGPAVGALARLAVVVDVAADEHVHGRCDRRLQQYGAIAHDTSAVWVGVRGRRAEI